jgi:hypothetical protein
LPIISIGREGRHLHNTKDYAGRDALEPDLFGSGSRRLASNNDSEWQLIPGPRDPHYTAPVTTRNKDMRLSDSDAIDADHVHEPPEAGPTPAAGQSHDVVSPLHGNGGREEHHAPGTDVYGNHWLAVGDETSGSVARARINVIEAENGAAELDEAVAWGDGESHVESTNGDRGEISVGSCDSLASEAQQVEIIVTQDAGPCVDIMSADPIADTDFQPLDENESAKAGRIDVGIVPEVEENKDTGVYPGELVVEVGSFCKFILANG